MHCLSPPSYNYPIFSDNANYTKEIRIAKYNTRGDVVMHCLLPPVYMIIHIAATIRGAQVSCLCGGESDMCHMGPFSLT